MFRTIIKSGFLSFVSTVGAGIMGGIAYEYQLPYWIIPFVLGGFMVLTLNACHHGYLLVEELYWGYPALFNRNYKWNWDSHDRAWTRSCEVDDGYVVACVVRTPLLVGSNTNPKPYFGALWHHCGGELFPLDDKEFASLKEAKAWCDRQLLVA